MAERQGDLGKRSEETPHEPLQNGEYFSRLSLRQIYGDYTVKPGTTIVTDIPNDANFDHTLFDDHERLRELAKRYGIPHIGSATLGGIGTKWQKPFVEITAGMGPPMTHWAPFVAERGTLLALAHSLGEGEAPTILDVGCAEGFTSKLLAADGYARVIGIDQQFSAFEPLPITPGNLNLREGDIFDIFDEFGPQRSAPNQMRIKEILHKIRDSFADKREMHYWATQHGMGFRYGDFSEEVNELQELAGQYEQPSPIDILLCSFMTTGVDLTLAIRDGIRPKAIVYVKPMNGLAGVGDFYAESDTNDSGDPNEVVSFNPGRNYRTVTRWRTFWSDEWSREVYERPLGIEPAEVVVQLRKDIAFQRPKSTDITVKTYPWDKEIADIIRKHNAKPKVRRIREKPFYLGIGDVKALLPGSNQ